MAEPTPIPDGVADFKAARLPQRTRDAVLARADAERNLRLCRSPYTREARERAISDITRADKTLATIPQRLGGGA